MNTQELKELKNLLEKFVSSDIFGLGEMKYIAQVNNVIELVDGAIINNENE